MLSNSKYSSCQQEGESEWQWSSIIKHMHSNQTSGIFLISSSHPLSFASLYYCPWAYMFYQIQIYSSHSNYALAISFFFNNWCFFSSFWSAIEHLYYLKFRQVKELFASCKTPWRFPSHNFLVTVNNFSLSLIFFSTIAYRHLMSSKTTADSLIVWVILVLNFACAYSNHIIIPGDRIN